MPPTAQRKASQWGAWVRKVRDHAGLNQTDFGAKIDRTKGTITDWERGINDPERESVEAILRAFPSAPPPPSRISANPAGSAAMSDPGRRVRPPQLEAYFARNREDLTERERRYLEGLRSMEEAGAPAPDDQFYDAMLDAFRELRRRRAQREGGSAGE
jgi:transcriptional regulator with XRE-family HTH domain